MCRRRAPAKACPARTNDHSEPGNCRAAPRAFARSTSLCFRAHLRFAASPTGRAQLRRSEQPPRAVLFVHPVLLCLTPSVLATVNAQGRWVFYKRKSAPVTRCAFFLAPPVGLEPTGKTRINNRKVRKNSVYEDFDNKNCILKHANEKSKTKKCVSKCVSKKKKPTGTGWLCIRLQSHSMRQIKYI